MFEFVREESPPESPQRDTLLLHSHLMLINSLSPVMIFSDHQHAMADSKQIQETQSYRCLQRLLKTGSCHKRLRRCCMFCRPTLAEVSASLMSLSLWSQDPRSVPEYFCPDSIENHRMSEKKPLEKSDPVATVLSLRRAGLS